MTFLSTIGVKDEPTLRKELDRLDANIKTWEQLGATKVTISLLIENIHLLDGIPDAYTRRMNTMLWSVEKILNGSHSGPEEKNFLADSDLDGIQIRIHGIKGNWKSKKYLWTIDGASVELSMWMFRVLNWIITYHPWKYKPATTDLKYLRRLQRLFPQDRLKWAKWQWCWIEEREKLIGANDEKSVDGGTSIPSSWEQNGNHTPNGLERRDYSAPPKFPRGRKKVSSTPKVIDSFETMVWDTNLILTLEDESKCMYLFSFSWNKIPITFSSAEHRLLQRIISGERFWIMWDLKSTLDYINLKLERVTPFSIESSSWNHCFIFTENKRVSKPVSTWNDKQQASAAYTWWRQLYIRNQNLAAKIARWE